MKNILLTIYLIGASTFVFSQTNISGIINSYAEVTAINICAARITVVDASSFNVGDSILIIQMQGATINTTNTASFGDIAALGSAGNYEKNVITTKTGNVLTYGQQLVNTYDVSGAVQVVRIPHYTGNVNVNGVLTAADWNGATGGVLIFSATGTVSLLANIDIRAKGFRGGSNVLAPPYNCSFISNINGYFYPQGTEFGAGKGEGIVAFLPGQEAGRGKYANGGGGGNDHNAGGAGAGNGSSGGNGGTNSEPGPFNCKGLFPGIGGLALPYTTNRLFMGGGGGAGHGNNAAYSAPDGAGIVIIRANSILGVSGSILANGLNGALVSNDGGIGASAGGSVLLEVQSWAANLLVSVSGGNGGNTANIGNRCYGPGGGGGAGVLAYNLASFGNTLVANPGNSGIVTTSTNACLGSTLGATNGGGLGLSLANRQVPLSLIPAGPDTASVVSLGLDTIELCVGQDYTFNLGASAGHAIQWQIDSTGIWEDLIPDSHHANVTQSNGFIIMNVQTFMDYYSYRMRVASPCDTAYSDRIYIHVVGPPVVNTEPSSVNACAGGNAFFAADVSNATSYQWQILFPTSGNLVDNANYSGTQTDSLFITNIPAGLNGASYRLQAINSCGTSLSSPVFLNFTPSPITIGAQSPTNVSLCVGSSGILYFTSSSVVDNIQWQVNMGSGFVNIANGALYAGVNNDTLTFLNPSLVQNGYSYQAVLSNSCGGTATSAPITVTVNESPSISTFAVNACEGNGASFTPALASGTATSFLWQIDSIGGVWEDIAYTGGYSNPVGLSLSLSSGLVTMALDGNLYRIIINTNCGSDTSNGGLLNVTPRVVYSAQPINDTVCLGDTAVISATANNAFTYQWQSNAGGPFANLSNNATFGGVNTNSLAIFNVGPAQVGVQYRLRTTGNSPCGNVNSSTAQIYLNSGINAIASTSSSFNYCPGLDTILYFSFTGVVDSIFWQVDNGSGMLDLSTDFYHSNVNNDTLVLTGMDASLDGNSYRAIIINSCGLTDTSALIQTTIYQVPSYSFGPNQSVCVGDEAQFTQTTSSPVVGKQWQIWNGVSFVNLTNGGPYSGVNADTLRINPVDVTMNNDSFRVAVFDSCGALTQNLIAMVLNVAAPSTSSQTFALCNGDSLVLSDGTVVNTTGSYNDTISGGASNACDSIITYNLTIFPLNTTSEIVNLCFGDSLLRADGSFENSSGVYSDTLVAGDVNGCDSIHTITLNISPLITSNNTVVLCFGDSFQLNDGSFVTSSGIYNDTIVAGAASACDSIHIIDLTILPVITSNRNEVRCFGDSLQLADGSFVTISGIYNDTITGGSSQGCDSIDIINLVVAPLITNLVNSTICSNDSLVLSNGTIVNSSGTYNDTLTAANGCDSILIYNLSVNPTSNFVDNQSICNGQQYVLPGGGIATASGVFLDTLVGANSLGCDSIIETNLTVLTNPNTIVVDSFCSGQSYTLAGGIAVSAPGLYNDTLFAAASNGCDSLLLYDLSFTASPAAVQVNDTICFNELYTLPDGLIVNTSGTYTDTIPASNTCDSIVVTNLFVRPANSILAQSTDLSLCSDSDALFFVTSAQTLVSYQWFLGGTPLAGATNDTLNVFNVSNSNAGQIYQVEIYGVCDTVLSNSFVLNVRGNATILTNPLDVVVCEGATASFSITTDLPVQSFQWYVNGGAIPNSNSASFTTAALTLADDANQYFCVIIDSCGVLDSSLLANLNITPNLNITASSSSLSVCATEDLLFFVQATGSTISYQWLENGVAMPGENNDTLSLLNVNVGQDGNSYACQINSDCGNVLTNNMVVSVNDTGQLLNQSADITQCGGFSFELFVEADGVATYQWQINQGGGFVNLNDGTLGAGPIEITGSNTAILTMSNYDLSISGAQFQVLLTTFCGTPPGFNPVTVTITEPVIITDRVADTVFCLREISPIYVPYVDGAAEWSNGSFGQYLVPDATGDYIVNFVDENSCPQSDTIFVELEDCVANCVVLAPTGFSPNVNGVNDVFKAIYTCELEFYELMILNRWGELIFMSSDPLTGWDGTFKGNALEIGTYTWYIVYKKVGADRKEDLKGNVTLIR